MSSPIDRLIGKVGEKAFAAIAMALGAAIMALVASIEKWFATRKAYSKGRKDERTIWEAQEKEWKRKVEEIKQSNRSLWEKLKEIKRLRKEFEEYKLSHK